MLRVGKLVEVWGRWRRRKVEEVRDVRVRRERRVVFGWKMVVRYGREERMGRVRRRVWNWVFWVVFLVVRWVM